MQYKIWPVMLVCATGGAFAQEDPQNSCSKILELYDGGDLDGALEEARWCVEALEQVRQRQESAFFRDEIGGWARSSLDQNKAMGVALTEARYQKDGKTITASLMGGAGAGGGLGGMDIFGAIAGAGMMSTGNRMRVQGHSATANTDNGPQIMVTLDSGGYLQFASTDASLDEVTAFAEAFPITELDDARR
jgi:hypothetical protein